VQPQRRARGAALVAAWSLCAAQSALRRVAAEVDEMGGVGLGSSSAYSFV
jgi:hypothetical protein